MEKIKGQNRGSHFISWKTADQFLKYTFTGMLMAATNIFLLYFFTVFIGMWYVLSTAVSTLLVFFMIFILNKFWSFRVYSKTKQQSRKYVILGIVDYFLVVILIYYFTEYIFYSYLVSMFVIIALQASKNFILYKYWVFK